MKTFIKILLLATFIINHSALTIAQNLVPNPSFEEHTQCPDGQCQIYKATGWHSFGYTPDYFNACGSHGWTTPQNVTGYQNPATGNAYVEIGTYSFANNIDVREYIGAQLLEPLNIGTKYYVSFKAVHVENSNCANNKLGVLFSTVSYALDTPCSSYSLLHPSNFAHIYENNIITDTANWETISGSIVADSAYQYIIIGNFYDNNHTDTIKYNNNQCIAVYFIDDIYVSENPEFIPEVNTENFANIIYSDGLIFVNTSQNLSDSLKTNFQIFDISGRQVLSDNFDQKNFTVNIKNLPKGMYIVKIQNSNRIHIQKIIK